MMQGQRCDNRWYWRPGGMVGVLLLGIATAGTIVRGADPAEKPVLGKELSIARAGDCLAIKQGEQVLLRYRDRNVRYKPYVQELTTPSGINILRDAPADHLHHHGLMFAWRVNGIGFWEETPASGREIHVSWKALRIVGDRGSAESAELHEQLKWQGKDSQVLLEEERVLRIRAARPGQPRVLSWQSRFTAPPADTPTTLGGSVYYGLGARFLPSMDTGGTFLNSSGDRGVAATNGRQADWCAFTAEASPGHPVCLVMFDAPGNPRHPARWFAMNKPFAYLAATLGLDKEPLKLESRKQLTLRYGVALFDGTPSRETLDAAYAGWQKKD